MNYSYDTEYLDLSELYFYINDKCYSIKDIYFKVDVDVTYKYDDETNNDEDMYVEDAELDNYEFSLWEWDENGYEHDVDLKNLSPKEQKKVNEVVEGMLNDFINDCMIGYDLGYTDEVIDEINEHNRAYKYLKFWSKEPKYNV